MTIECQVPDWIPVFVVRPLVATQILSTSFSAYRLLRLITTLFYLIQERKVSTGECLELWRYCFDHEFSWTEVSSRSSFSMLNFPCPKLFPWNHLLVTLSPIAVLHILFSTFSTPLLNIEWIVCDVRFPPSDLWAPFISPSPLTYWNCKEDAFGRNALLFSALSFNLPLASILPSISIFISRNVSTLLPFSGMFSIECWACVCS